MQRGLCFFLMLSTVLWAQAQTLEITPQILTRTLIEGKVTLLELGLHFTTAIRLPEPVSSVVVGDPVLFKVEHSELEPQLVFVKPTTLEAAQTNLLISTARGRQASFLLITRDHRADDKKAPHPVHFLIRYPSAQGFLIDAADQPSVLVPETVTLPEIPVEKSVHVSAGEEPTESPAGTLRDFLTRQRQASLPPLKGDHFRAGISEVMEQGRQVFVLFSVVNFSKRVIELMPPQVQLSATARSGRVVRHQHSSISEPLPVTHFLWSYLRLEPSDRSDGVAVFEKPPFKQSNQTLFLQIAESGAVDRPVLVPIQLERSRILNGDF